MSAAGDIMDEVLGLFLAGGATQTRFETVAGFFDRHGLPLRMWTGQGYELASTSSCVVSPVSDNMSYGEEQRISAVVLVAEELAARGQPVPPELAAVAVLALSLGLVTVTRKASS